MTDATELDTAAIRARLEAATEGPWFVEPCGDFGAKTALIPDVLRERYGVNGLNCGEDFATAEFIAHAHTDVGLLLTALDEARAEVAEIAATALTIDRERMAAEGALAAVRALADRWAKEADERGDDDLLYTRGVANMLAAALATPTTTEGSNQAGHHLLAAECRRDNCAEVHYARQLPDPTTTEEPS